MALAAYRHLLRSIHIAFKGDARMLAGARAESRARFRQLRHLAPASGEAQAALAEARDVATILRQNVVQGAAAAASSDSTAAAAAAAEEGGDGDTFRLRIHEHTERGDNESIKIAGKRFQEMRQRPAAGHSVR